MREILVMTSAYTRPPVRTEFQGGGEEAAQPLGTGVFGQFPWWGIAWQCCIWQLSFFWLEIMSEEQRGKD